MLWLEEPLWWFLGLQESSQQQLSVKFYEQDVLLLEGAQLAHRPHSDVEEGEGKRGRAGEGEKVGSCGFVFIRV